MRARLTTLCVGLLMAAGFLLAAPGPAQATFSGGNGKIVFASNRDGDFEIFVADSGGGPATQLTFNTASDTEPNLSADGQRIVFVSDRDGKAELYVMNMDGSGQTRVTTNNITESHPIWAPNATLIGFAGLNGADSEIYTVKPTGTNLIDLTNDPVAFDANPAWSPGGQTIAFDSTNRGGNLGTDVYTMAKDGSGVKRLTTTGTDSHPNWSPDNKNLVFESGRDNTSGPSVFASISKPVGIATTATRVLVTQFTSDKVMSLNTNGQVSTFATLPTTGRKVERYLAVSPGLGGFAADDVYVTVGQDIYRVSPDGATVALFVNIHALATGETGITFDTVGTFGFNMILTDRRGPVWTVDATGVATLVGDVGAQIEGPFVAPMSFDPVGGQVLMGNEFQDKLFAMTSTGVVSTAATLESPEATKPVPGTVCSFGTSGGAFFVAMEDMNQILKFPPGDFAGMAGTMLVPSELDTSIATMNSVGGSIVIGSFIGPIGTPDLEGSSFATCGAGPQFRLRTSGGSAAAAAPAGGASLPREIYKMTELGLNQTRLTSNSFDDGVPVWSPNNKTIVFQSDRDDPSAPGCESTQTCVFDLYSMNAADGSGQTNSTNNLAANDIQADWEAVGGTVTVSDFTFAPGTSKPKQGSAVLWNFNGPTPHTATDTTGMALYDSGSKNPGEYFVYSFAGAGTYPYFCSIHPTMTGTVKVPILASPVSGNETTTFTITWAVLAPTGFRYDVQIKRPTSSDFVDWKTNQLVRMSSFVPDAGPGVYSFQARLEKISDGTASGYSTPVSITVS